MSALAPRAQYPSFKFDHLGAEIDGIIVAPPEDRQATDYTTRQPKFWPDGNPIMQTRVILRVSNGQDYAIYAEGRMARAITAALRDAGAGDLEVNGRLWVKHHELGERKAGGQPPKLYQAKYLAPVRDDEPEPPW